MQTGSLILELKEELYLDVRVGEWITIMGKRWKKISIQMHCYLVQLESSNYLLKWSVNHSHRFPFYGDISIVRRQINLI